MKPEKSSQGAYSFVASLTLILLTPSWLQAQGQIFWRNHITTATFSAPVYGVDPTDPFTPRTGNSPTGAPAGTQTYGGPLLAGTGYSISLFIGLPGTPSHLLREVDTVTFRTGNAAGFFLPQDVFAPGIPPGTEVIAQCRAWNNQGGIYPTWGSLPLDPAYGGVSDNLEIGVSDVFRVDPLGGVSPDGMVVFHVPSTTELRSFNLVIVPEPSMIGLIALGLGVVCWRLRRGRD